MDNDESGLAPGWRKRQTRQTYNPAKVCNWRVSPHEDVNIMRKKKVVGAKATKELRSIA
jgi:hypothetical protein